MGSIERENQMSYYDQQFRPWEIVDDKCVVADEAEWRKLGDLGFSFTSGVSIKDMAEDVHQNRPVVKITTDIFEDVRGPVYASNSKVLNGGPNGDGTWNRDNWWHCDHTDSPRIQTCDVVRRCLQTIDSTSNVDYLIVTQRPELVREKWIGCKRDHNKDGDCDRRKNGYPKSNVILAIPVETQNDIDRLVPELLKCHDLCKGLAVICNPTEDLDFRTIKSQMNDTENEFINALEGQGYYGHSSEVFVKCPSINLLIVEGNEHPIHPDWLRSLRDQCNDANVKFNFASWGRWAPRTTHEESLTGQDQHTAFIDGMPGYKFPEDYRMVNWGRERSGRLLDSVEHNGVLEVKHE